MFRKKRDNKIVILEPAFAKQAKKLEALGYTVILAPPSTIEMWR